MALFSPLYNLPNHVVEKQKRYQNDTRAIYLRTPRSRLYFGSYIALFTVGMSATTIGAWQMIKGKSD
ncbi:hypothetical protein FA13DRAFT_1726233 [Coprinellus micaceus]|uniref:Uncharacterized protein n=1 Tax=Coprinellus micaceus TaxID=71717 RepID=A0A4Y7TU62_COPMI|nr:hypothetical protein FA13DRAFT_1726233 [Coprinellus micaceus]